MTRYEIILYSRSSGDVRHSTANFRTQTTAEKELKKAGFTQNPRLPDIWYSELYYAKVKEVVP